MSIQVLWTFILKFYYIKMIWIFIFVILFTTAFTLVTFGNRKEELQKRIFPDDCGENEIINNTLESQFSILNKCLEENENLLNDIKKKMNETEEVLQNFENQNGKIHSQHKNFIYEMKQEILTTEKEIKRLQFDISSLGERRKLLKEDVMQHKQMCEDIIGNCRRDLATTSRE